MKKKLKMTLLTLQNVARVHDDVTSALPAQLHIRRIAINFTVTPINIEISKVARDAARRCIRL